MYRACARCGKIHDASFTCNVGKVYTGGRERAMRSSYSWQKKAEEIKDMSQHLCAVCREQGRYVYAGLEVHHIVKLRDDPDGLLDDSNLVCLCTNCHKLADSGDISADYLRELARRRGEG